MIVKKHQDPTVLQRRAVAPYNFVSLPEEVLPAPELPDLDNYELNSGFFDCVLETSSPVYIRGLQRIDLFRRLSTKKPNDVTVSEKMERAPFFHVGSTAQIPGSSLRGLFRTLVEIISWSKPLSVSADPLVYRSVDTTSNGIKYRNRLMEEVSERTFRPKIKAGYMRRREGDWYIQPAVEVRGVSYARISHDILFPIINDLAVVNPRWDHVRKIFVDVGAPTYQPVREFLNIWYAKVLTACAGPRSGYIQAVVSESGPMQSKKSEAIIFSPDSTKNTPQYWIPISDELVFQYRENLSQQNRRFLGANGVLQEGYPVFYLVEDEKLIAFGHCQMLRLPYRHTPHDLVQLESRNEDNPDLAEAVFGYAGKEYGTGGSRSGRVSFSDGICLPGQENIFLQVIRPQILSTPKPTSFQLYLTQDDPDNKDNLQDYDSGANIRGTKFYWHKDDRLLKDIETTDPQADRHESQYTRIKPVRAGVSFQFQIHFHNLTDLELGLLGWALAIGKSNRTRLKLGMGKPLGMGAVKIVSAQVHIYDRYRRYSALFVEGEGNVAWELGEKPEVESRHVLDKAQIAYKEWILTQPAANPDGAKNFANLPRIQELLQVLNWPGPSPVDRYTRYQSIQRKEFRDRPVLPTPAGVLRNLPDSQPSAPKKQETRSQSTTKINNSAPKPPTEVSDRAEDQFAQLQELLGKNSQLPERGQIVTAVVLEDSKKGVTLEIIGQPEQILGWITPEVRGEKRFSVEHIVRCRVVGKGRQEGSDWLFDLEPVD